MLVDLEYNIMGRSSALIDSVSDYSFEQAIERNIYAFPSSYNRRESDYVAFYRGKPIGGITHYAEIKEVLQDQTDFLSQPDRALMFPKRVEEPATIFKLDDLIEFNNPITSEGESWIQSVMYRDLESLKEAESIEDLMS